MVVDKVGHALVNMSSCASIDLASCIVIGNSFVAHCQDMRAQVKLTFLIQFELSNHIIEFGGAADVNN